MKEPVAQVSSWQISLAPEERRIVLCPWVAQPGGTEMPSREFALSLEIARMLQRQLAESIRILDEQVATAVPGERRRRQEAVANERRRERRFEGSPSPQDGEARSPEARTEPKTPPE